MARSSAVQDASSSRADPKYETSSLRDFSFWKASELIGRGGGEGGCSEDHPSARHAAYVQPEMPELLPTMLGENINL